MSSGMRVLFTAHFAKKHGSIRANSLLNDTTASNLDYSIRFCTGTTQPGYCTLHVTRSLHWYRTRRPNRRGHHTETPEIRHNADSVQRHIDLLSTGASFCRCLMVYIAKLTRPCEAFHVSFPVPRVGTWQLLRTAVGSDRPLRVVNSAWFPA